MPDSVLDETLALVRAARDGDSCALEALFERYYPRVCRIVSLRLGQTMRRFLDHEDLVQDSLMDAFRSLDGFGRRSEGSFRNWLACVVENNIRDQWRRATAAKRGGVPAPSMPKCGDSLLSESLFPGRGPTPSQAAAARELEERLEQALLSLDERLRRVIEMRRLCGMSYAEIAEELELGGESSARSLLARAVSKLSSYL